MKYFVFIIKLISMRKRAKLIKYEDWYKNADPQIRDKWLSRVFRMNTEEYLFYSKVLNNFLGNKLNKILQSTREFINHWIDKLCTRECHIF